MMNMNNLAQTHEILTPQLATKVGLTKFEFYKYVKANEYEQVGHGVYRDNFIIKGGILVTAMIGVAHRSTMDIDTSMKNLNLSAEDALRVVNQVKDIDLDDGVSFEVKDVSNIMDEMEYPGIRVTMNASVISGVRRLMDWIR